MTTYWIVISILVALFVGVALGMKAPKPDDIEPRSGKKYKDIN